MRKIEETSLDILGIERLDYDLSRLDFSEICQAYFQAEPKHFLTEIVLWVITYV